MEKLLPVNEFHFPRFRGCINIYLHVHYTCECVLVAQSCLTLCDPMDCSPSGSSAHEIFQARILEWVAISSPGDLPNPGIEPGSPALQANSLLTELQACTIRISDITRGAIQYK